MNRVGVEARKKQYFDSLFSYFHDNALKQNTKHRMIRALFEVGKKKGGKMFITLNELEQKAGTRFGIDAWVSTAIVEKAEGRRAYRIREEFCQAVKKALG